MCSVAADDDDEDDDEDVAEVADVEVTEECETDGKGVVHCKPGWDSKSREKKGSSSVVVAVKVDLSMQLSATI